MFGDILSDEATMLTGSIGMLASASMGEGAFGLYEPVHGSAPDIAGQGLANPIATILSVALMYRPSFGYEDAADAIERAVAEVLDAGHRTADIAVDKSKALSTTEMGDLIALSVNRGSFRSKKILIYNNYNKVTSTILTLISLNDNISIKCS